MTAQTTSLTEAHELFLTQLIVETLNLQLDAATIDVNVPLSDGGLELDSIDMLEVVLAVSQTYGVKLRAEDKNNEKIFGSVAHLSAHIQSLRI